jgi:hypothetical protein
LENNLEFFQEITIHIFYIYIHTHTRCYTRALLRAYGMTRSGSKGGQEGPGPPQNILIFFINQKSSEIYYSDFTLISNFLLTYVVHKSIYPKIKTLLGQFILISNFLFTYYSGKKKNIKTLLCQIKNKACSDQFILI